MLGCPFFNLVAHPKGIDECFKIQNTKSTKKNPNLIDILIF